MNATMKPLLFLCFLPFLLVNSDLIGKICGNLPTGRENADAVYDGTAVYFLGGATRFDDEFPLPYLDEVVQLDLATNEAEIIGRFPYPISSGGAAAGGNGNIFYFGGVAEGQGSQSVIYKLSRANPNPVAVNNLTQNLVHLSAVAVGNSIYLIGGSYTNEIIRYDTELNTLDTVAYLQSNVSGTSAVFDGEDIYIFGGYTEESYPKPNLDVFKFNPVSLTVNRLKTDLTHQITMAVAVNRSSVLFGYKDHAYGFTRFDHSNQALDDLTLDAPLEFMNGPTSVYVPQNKHLYIIGGGGPGPYCTTIHCIDMTNV